MKQRNQKCMRFQKTQTPILPGSAWAAVMTCRRRLSKSSVGLAVAIILLLSPSHSFSFQPNPKYLPLGEQRHRTESGSGCRISTGITTNSGFSMRSSAPFWVCSWRTSLSRLTAKRAKTEDGGALPEDEAEWRALISAFRMYKAAYGDLKVPQRFVVPNMKPWPVAAHNLKLGKVVANIRATGRYIQNNPERRVLLEELGFIWRVRDTTSPANVDWEQVCTALEAYRKLIDANEDVPASFIVPELPGWPESVRGLPLGRQLAVVRSTVLPENAKARDAFSSLGVYVEGGSQETEEPKRLPANDLRFQKVFTALQTYMDLNGDLLVPQPFVVPSDDPEWPEETWGLRLGARVNAIRSQGTFVNNNPERRKMLDDLGFVWSPPKSARGKRRGRRTKAEMEQEEILAAAAAAATEPPSSVGDAAADLGAAAMDSLLEGSFMFDQDPYPPAGDTAGAAASSSTSPSWNLEGAHMPNTGTQQVEEAAPTEEYLPPRTLADSLMDATERALECGVIEGMTENKRVIKGKREKDIPWFNDDFGDEFVFEDVVEALTVYKTMYGDFSNLTASDEFVVPAPKEVTGFLDDVGFQFDADASARAAAAIASFEEDEEFESSQDLIAAEIRRLQEEVGEVPAAVEPEMTATKSPSSTTADSWPEHLAGMALGNIVQRIRDGSLEVKHLPERKAQLDALDFDWGDKKYFLDVPFEKAMCAMYAYYLVRGDMFVYEDFVMPDEDPWPKALAGYEIGKAVKRIRELQNFLEAYHPEKVSLLRMIDFVWFSDTMALPLDPDEAEETPESLLLSAFGHPDYAKMIDIPMGLPDKIVADGPFVETNDDPKLWWRKWHNWDYVKDYWYQQGRRDNGYVLRGMGYTQMAEEHEAKYGPGLFSQIDETLDEIEQEGALENKSAEEKQELLQKLSFYRQEMLGCTDIHPQDRDKLLESFDTHMQVIMKDTKLSMLDHDELAGDDEGEEYEEEEVEGEEYVEEGELDEEEFAEYEEEEFDVESELGLGQDRK